MNIYDPTATPHLLITGLFDDLECVSAVSGCPAPKHSGPFWAKWPAGGCGIPCQEVDFVKCIRQNHNLETDDKFGDLILRGRFLPIFVFDVGPPRNKILLNLFHFHLRVTPVTPTFVPN